MEDGRTDEQTDSFIVTRQHGSAVIIIHFYTSKATTVTYIIRHTVEPPCVSEKLGYSQSKHTVNVDTHLAQPRAELEP